MADDYIIAIPVYDRVDLMDIAAPYEVFGWLAQNWKERNVLVYIVAEDNLPVKSRDNFAFIPHKTFEQVPHVDLLWIPGGNPDALVVQMKNSRYTQFIQSRSEKAQYVTSVCEGALIAANAGLFDTYEVTTHWAFKECLKSYPKVKVARGYPRYVHDHNRITGGGISSGLDEAFYIVKILAGEEMAIKVQSVMQYFPDPPVQGKLPPTPPGCPLKGQLPVG